MMTFAAPRRFGIGAIMLGGVLALPNIAWAEATQPGPGGRAWTDPPPREAVDPKPAVPMKPAPKAEAPKASHAPRPALAQSRASSPSIRATRTVKAAPAVRSRVVASRRPVPTPAIRTVTMHPSAYAPPSDIRYGYVVESVPGRAVLDEDDRARRIRQAEEAGYLVLRSRSVEFPDGRRLRTYRPIDEETDD